MRKFFFLIVLVWVSSATTFARESYKLDETSVEAAFAKASEISLSAEHKDFLLALTSESAMAAVPADGDLTKGGYLLRSFFCGFVGLHRSYMGTNGKTLWYYYFCIPVYGGIVNFVDFWGVVFGADYMKYKNNSKFNVWWSN